jgi:hypothetical protein
MTQASTFRGLERYSQAVAKHSDGLSRRVPHLLRNGILIVYVLKKSGDNHYI